MVDHSVAQISVPAASLQLTVVRVTMKNGRSSEKNGHKTALKRTQHFSISLTTSLIKYYSIFTQKIYTKNLTKKLKI